MKKYIDILNQSLNEGLAKEDVLVNKTDDHNDSHPDADAIDTDGDGEKEDTKKLLVEEPEEAEYIFIIRPELKALVEEHLTLKKVVAEYSDRLVLLISTPDDELVRQFMGVDGVLAINPNYQIDTY